MILYIGVSLFNQDQVWGSDFNDKIDILNKLQQGPSE